MENIIGMEHHIGGMSGLVCSSIEVFKCLENLDNLEYLYAIQFGMRIGDKNTTIIDLSKTNLKESDIRRSVRKNLFTK